jgi:hypothetical protein
MLPKMLERQQAHDDEQAAAEHFPAPLDVRRNRPTDQDDESGAKAEQQRMPEREPRRHAQSPRPLGRRSTVGAVHRQRRDGHQVITTKTMQKP